MSKKSKKESTLYYFHSVGCVYCSKVEPIIDKLNSNGYDIIKLDETEKDNKLFKKEIQDKFKIKCGTPLLVDSKTGNSICGLKDENTIKKWANGEKITEPPKPKSPPPTLPQNWDDEKLVEDWKKSYVKWKDENNHLPNIQPVDDVIKRLKQQWEVRKKQQSLDSRLTTIEMNLQKLMNHLGVK
tara:strand:+ start:109 stop:660 length:552 start_codon:yes stop_codon:yes gene_type:complete